MCVKAAIITGATSGLGKTYAYHLAKDGWNLYLTGRRLPLLQSIKVELEQLYKVKVQIHRVDFFNSKELNEFINSIKKLPQINLLINNAGFGNRSDFFEHSFSVQYQMLKVHIIASSKIIHEVVPKMKLQKSGSIINVSSLCAYLPSPLSYFYCASKAFLVSLSECMHIDLKPYNIKVQALCPGFINTDFHRRMNINVASTWLERKLLFMNQEAVVRKSLKQLSAKKVICIPGIFNRLIYHIVLLLPKAIYYKLTGAQSNRLKANQYNNNTSHENIKDIRIGNWSRNGIRQSHSLATG